MNKNPTGIQTCGIFSFLDLVSDEDIEKVADWINNYPRKLFNGKTSKTMLISWLGSLS